MISGVNAQREDENARDIFLGSRREKAKEVSRKGNKQMPLISPDGKEHVEASSAKVSGGKAAQPKRRRTHTTSNNTLSRRAASTETPNPVIGLGYTLFFKNEQFGKFVRANPKRVFRTNQSIRILVESNMDGYIYIFHQANKGSIRMLFPAWEAHGGSNQIWAHFPQIVPDPNVFEFTFKGEPAMERITIVVSRNPIAGIPIGQDLRGLKKVNISDRLFRKISRRAPYREYHRSDEGSLMTDREGARDIEMTESDPMPTHILLSGNTNNDRIVAQLNLEHRGN